MKKAVDALKKGFKDDEKEVPVIISELRKAGYLKTELDPGDNRKRIYTLVRQKTITEAFEELDGKKKLTRSDIEGILKKAADLIRTRVDYKFILILLFLKRINDKWDEEYDKAYKEALADGLNEKEAREEASAVEFHSFDLPEETRWEYIRKDVSKVTETLSKAFKILAERNPTLKDVIDSVDFIQFTSNRENSEILRQLVELFSEKKLTHVSADILGDAYEWILQYFAPDKAKEGEVYTPREVIKLIVEILDPQPGESVYDPASASNGMLIVSHEHVKDKYGPPEVERLFLYGQEANPKTLALGRMNLYIHDIKNHRLAPGDTLLYPKFKDGENLKRFDNVIANPPWNQDGYQEEVLKKADFRKQRYSYYVPKQSADWAWIQHMLASAKDNTGRVGVVIDNGCLFRGGKEKTVRQAILEADFIECVILLPEKLFYNTGAPGAIMILRKNKPEERKGKVFFINASEQSGKHPEVRKLNRLEDEHIRKIVEAYRKFEDVEGFAAAATMEDIRENDYNMNVSLYAFPLEEIEEIDVNREWNDLKDIEREIASVEEKIEVFLEVIG